MKLLDSIRLITNTNPFRAQYKVNRLRPPGSIDEVDFIKRCVRCSRCIDVCPYGSVLRSDEITNGSIGTPFIYAEKSSCHLCMMCTSVCPTGAINKNITDMNQVSIGKAKIDPESCLNHLYSNEEESGNSEGNAAICSSCFNSCPLRFDAIYLENGIIPIVTDKCTGCGVCVERCPTAPKSVCIIPKGMPDKDSAGYYNYLKREKAGK